MTEQFAERFATLKAAAESGKRAETDYGQSFIRRNFDIAKFEDAVTPDAILELLSAYEELEAASKWIPAKEFERGWRTATRSAAAIDPWKEHLAGNPIAAKLTNPGQCVEVKNKLILSQACPAPTVVEEDAQEITKEIFKHGLT